MVQKTARKSKKGKAVVGPAPRDATTSNLIDNQVDGWKDISHMHSNTSKNCVLLWTLFNFANHCGKIIFFTWHSHFIQKNINLWFKYFHGGRLIKRKTTCPAKVAQNTKRKK